MSIFTSNLKNDQDMIRALGSAAVPIPLVVDAAFSGVGTDNIPITIAVERKKLGDLAQCVYDGRYLFQAQSAKSAGYDVLCLIVEGVARSSVGDGLLEIPVWKINPKTGKYAQCWTPILPTITYSRFDQYLTELDYLVGIIVKRTVDVKETAAVILALQDNFQRTPEQHSSLNKIFTAPMVKIPLVRPGLVRRMAKELDGIGWGKSEAVAGYFKTVENMVNATTKEWCEVDGIGKTIARKVVASMRGEK